MRKVKRAISVFLAGAISVVTCACGSANEANPNQPTSSTVSNTLTKEGVYRYETIDFGFDLSKVEMFDLLYTNDRIYTVVVDYGDSLPIEILPLNGEADSSVPGDVQNADESTSSTEEAATEDTTVDQAETEQTDAEDMDAEDVTGESFTGVRIETKNQVIFVDEDASSDYVPKYCLVSVGLDGSDKQYVPLYLDEKLPLTQGYLSGMRLLQDGSVVACYDVYFEDLSDPMNPIYSEEYYLLRWDNQGKLLWTTNVTGEEGDYFYLNEVLVDDKNQLTVFNHSGEILTFDANGTILKREKSNTLGVSNINQIITCNDGTAYITSNNEEGSRLFINTYDYRTGQLGEAIELPQNFFDYYMYCGTNNELLLCNSSGIYTYRIGDSQPAVMLDFVNSDMATFGVDYVNMLDEQTFIAGFYDMAADQNVVAKFSYVKPEDVPDKKPLVLGCNYLGGDIKSRIIQFNKTNPNYRITVKDYSSYNTLEDYSLSLNQMNQDILSGNMPDIMIVGSTQDISGWANKGLLADIGEMIEKDPELSQFEYMENVWDAFSVNDKLHVVIPSFAVQTMIARKDMVGDRTSWTMSEFMDFMKTQEEGVSPFGGGMLRESFLHYIMLYCGSEFVDVNTGTCNFQSKEFISMLEYAKNFPVEYEPDYWDNYDWEAEQSMYRDKKAVLLFTYMSDVPSMIYAIHGQLGADAAYIGFPGVEGNSSVIQSSSDLFAISEKSANKEGAWDFVSYYLSEEYQNSENIYGLPVLKSALDDRLQSSTKRPSRVNEETGMTETYDYTYYMNGEEVAVDPFSQAEVDALSAFISSVNQRSYFNEDIINIVKEEAESFFSGQKSAEEVAGIIQSRIQIYVDENR